MSKWLLITLACIFLNKAGIAQDAVVQPSWPPALESVMEALKPFINGKPSVEQLSGAAGKYPADFLSGDTANVFIYQVKDSSGGAPRDMIIAVNEGLTTLKVAHTLDISGRSITPGTLFNDVLGQSVFPYALVTANNRLYIELPPKTFSAWVQGPSTVQPLHLLQFDAQVVNELVQTKWAVEQNDAIKSFDIERADDGLHFVKVGSRLSSSRDGLAEYDFVDATPTKNIALLYRVKLLGKDGSTAYSEPMKVQVGRRLFEARLKPNPVYTSAELELSGVTGTSTAAIAIVSAGGEKMYGETVRLLPGTNRVSIPVQLLQHGVYQLVVEAGRERKTISFVKE